MQCLHKLAKNFEEEPRNFSFRPPRKKKNLRTNSNKNYDFLATFSETDKWFIGSVKGTRMVKIQFLTPIFFGR
jgi:hypothetical protein